MLWLVRESETRRLIWRKVYESGMSGDKITSRKQQSRWYQNGDHRINETIPGERRDGWSRMRAHIKGHVVIEIII